MQNNYSLVYREEEREMFPTLKVRCTRVGLTLSLTHCALYTGRCSASVRLRTRRSAAGSSRIR